MTTKKCHKVNLQESQTPCNNWSPNTNNTIKMHIDQLKKN